MFFADWNVTFQNVQPKLIGQNSEVNLDFGSDSCGHYLEVLILARSIHMHAKSGMRLQKFDES